MDEFQLIIVIVTAVLFGLILIWAMKDYDEKKKFLLNGRESDGKYLFKNILAAYKDSYNLNINHGTLSQLKKIYRHDLTNLQNDEIYFICYGIQGLSFSYWIITNKHFIYFSKNIGVIYYNHNKKNEINDFLNTQKGWTSVFISYMTNAHDLLENKVYRASIELIEEKHLHYSSNEMHFVKNIDVNSIISSDSIENKLIKIRDLLDNGHISEEEYAKKRDDILKSII
jgi:hypothetical protein